MASIAAVALEAGITFMPPRSRAQHPECTPELSAGSTMAGLRDPTHPGDKPVLAASTAAEVAAFTAVAEAATAVAAGIDSSYEVT